MNLLIIEDQEDFIEKVSRACVGRGVNLLKPTDVDLTDDFSENEPIEDQLVARLRDISARHQIDLVLLDTDLSRAKGRLRTQTEYRQAFQIVGIPVCRYKKGQSTTKLAALQFVRRLAVDGASAVWVPKEKLDGDLGENLIPWLQKVHRGFAVLAATLQAQPALLQGNLGPAGILSTALARPDLKADLLGYTAQNFFFFATSIEDDANANPPHSSTQLGYWLYNYILAFPGPILNSVATAAYLNLKPASFQVSAVQALVEPARYSGPFHDLGAFYWREDLGQLLDGWNGDIANSPALQHQPIERVDDSPYGVAYYCVLTGEAITESEAAANPDWIPAGAQLTRIKESEFDELGPMLNI